MDNQESEDKANGRAGFYIAAIGIGLLFIHSVPLYVCLGVIGIGIYVGSK